MSTISILDKAVEALLLAKECGGEQDLHIYAEAHEKLSALRDEALAFDQKMNDEEIAPTGDSYNELFAIITQ